MWCNDPSIAHLKQFGYNIIRLPRADFGPLRLLARQGGELESLGEIGSLFEPAEDAPLPPVKRDAHAADISGQRTSDMKLHLGLDILGTVIGAMGGSRLGLDAKYEGARSIAFSYQDVRVDEVDVILLDQFLSRAAIRPSNTLSRLLESDAVFVTTAVLRSDRLTVEAKRRDGGSLEVSIPEVRGVVGGAVQVSGAGERGSRLTYAGPVPLSFGFRAVQLFYQNGEFTTFKPVKPGLAVTRGGDDDDPREGRAATVLSLDAPMAEIRF
jgi:hypothetical protein